MNILKSAVDLLAGGTVKTVAESVMKYFPPSMSDQEKSELALNITKEENQKDIRILELAGEADKTFNDRMIAMEGATEDLRSVPIIGAFIILLRGAQRPVWGFATLYIDLMVFSHTWKIERESLESATFLAVNILVLTFLFGERAVKYILPVVMRYFGVKQKNGALQADPAKPVA